MLKIAVCFFGITRSLTHTIRSIESRILMPAKSLGQVECFGHFFKLGKISNPRSGEFGALRQDEHKMLSFQNLILEDELSMEGTRISEVMAFGDSWKDDFRSMRNLFHQLHSLEAVTNLALARSPDIVIFARPDLRYHDSLAKPLRRICDARGKVALIPSWQHWRGGLNDRFALCTAEAASAYGFRGRDVVEFCTTTDTSLHSESLVRYSLERQGVAVELIPQRASRIRFDGKRRKENFLPADAKKFLKFRQRLNSLAAMK